MKYTIRIAAAAAAVVMLCWAPFPIRATSFPIALQGCNNSCGNVSVPYPFGIDREDCAKNKSFFLICNKTGLFFSNVKVSSISLENQTFTGAYPVAYGCYGYDNSTSPGYNNSTVFLYGNTDKRFRMIYLRSWPFILSFEHNKLFGLGCDTAARMGDSDGRLFGGGCISVCLNNTNFSLGVGSCQTAIPPNIRSLDIWVSSLSNHYYVVGFNPCSYGFVAENGFNFSTINTSALVNQSEVPRTPVALEWVVGDAIGDQGKCEASEKYDCSVNADCKVRKSKSGSICSCRQGFMGNPYLPSGCQDIDECNQTQSVCPEGSCENTNGSYICHCPAGMKWDVTKSRCKGLRLTILIPVIGVAILLVVVFILILYGYMNILQYRKFIENVNKAMVEIGFQKFEATELKRATKDYARENRLGEGGFGSVYKGKLDDGQDVAIKKSKGWKAKAKQNFINEMKIAHKVQDHPNIVKILGMCLETEDQLLVYEFIPNETLYFHINNKSSGVLKSWKARLRIASEIAEAINYMHSSAKPPVIHGDIKSTNILLDNQNTAKVADFGGSILTSQNQPEMGEQPGTPGYLDPEYEETKQLTEKSDVYSFGVVLVELLTGKTPSSTSSSKAGEPERDLIKEFISAVERKQIIQLLDEELKDDVDTSQIEQVAELVKDCLNKRGQDRPTMEVVAARLGILKGHGKNTNVLPKKTKETEGLTEVAEQGKTESCT